MENQIPEIVEELYQTYGSKQVQLGYPPQPSDIPHALWAFYQGMLVGVKIRAACWAELQERARPFPTAPTAQAH